MKKSFLIFLVLISISLASATDVAYIVKTESTAKANIMLILTQQNYTYNIINESQILTTNFSQYSVLLVQDNVKNKSFIPVTSKNTIFIDSSLAPTIWPGSVIGSTSTFKSNFEQLNTPFTQGFTSISFTAYSTTKSIDYMQIKPSYVSRVALTTGSSSPAGIVTYSNQLNLRTVFFGFKEIDFWSPETKLLFKNSLVWARSGSDFDQDGFFSENDCNDNNASINPNATEIPYNGVDENCDGLDLADIDADGYCKLGYIITNKALQCAKEPTTIGTDCNDNDATYNINSTNIYRNCKNDAPTIISHTLKSTVYETDESTVYIYAIDSENDNVTYSTNNPNFIQNLTNKNQFIWQTTYNDAGKYNITLTASDGQLQTSVITEIEVRNTNRAPVCTNIPTQQWQEDNNHTLNLGQYCSDPDNDELDFSLNSTSENKNITTYSLNSTSGEVLFTVNPDWYGTDWIIFNIFDGRELTNTNNITLDVTPINDAPISTALIENITLNENTNLSDYLNLNNFFADIDTSSLQFSVIGNSLINIIINNGLVSFSPQKRFIGIENIVFSAFDGLSTAYSNNITLNVLQVNEAPEFQTISCQTNIDEDTSYSCELNASDLENNTISYSVVNQHNLQCSILNNTVNYRSDSNYFGNADCTIRVNDDNSTLHNDYMLEVNISNVNDAPTITSFSPTSLNQRLMENKSQSFRITATDIDSPVLNYSWFLNSDLVSTSQIYNFNHSKGNYNLLIMASDGQYTISNSWSIIVGSLKEFTCSEVNGHIFNENQTCSGNILDVLDSTNSSQCCSVFPSARPPTFKGITQCKNISNSLNIQLSNLDSDIILGKEISFKIKAENNGNDDLDLEIEVYLYDLTTKEVVDDTSESVTVGEDKSETISFTLMPSKDLDEQDNYAIFYKAYDSPTCDQDYETIDIARENYDLVIDSFTISPSTAICGDTLNGEIKVENIGRKDTDVTLKVENSKLKISQRLETFNIEKYENSNTEEKTFSIKLPENAAPGTYNITAIAQYQNKQTQETATITISDCQKQTTQQTTQTNQNTETLSLNKPTKTTSQGLGSSTIWMIVVAMIIIFTILAIILLYFYAF